MVLMQALAWRRLPVVVARRLSTGRTALAHDARDGTARIRNHRTSGREHQQQSQPTRHLSITVTRLTANAR